MRLLLLKKGRRPRLVYSSEFQEARGQQSFTAYALLTLEASAGLGENTL